MSMYLTRKIYPDEIAKPLCALAGEEEAKTVSSVEEALYQLKAIAENEYNSDYWRVLWRVLCAVSESDY